MIDLSIQSARIAVYHRGDGVHPHTHAFYQMYHVISGEGYAKAGEEMVKLEENMVVFFPPNVMHSVFDVGENALRLINIQFQSSDPLLQEELANAGFSNYVSEEILRLLWKVKEEWSGKGEFAKEMSEVLLGQYLLSFLRYTRKSDIQNEIRNMYRLDMDQLSGVARLVAGYIQQHMVDGFTLEQMANDLAYSKNYLCRVFRQKTGLTIVNYANRLRIGKAIELIRFTDKKLYEIAKLAGFADFHYFSRLFKEITGYSPGELRDKEIFSIYMENQGSQQILYRYFAEEDAKKGKRP